MLSAPNFSLLNAKEKDALIVQLLARLEALERENAGLREKLNLPPKTPDNSSTPPAAGHKSSGETTCRPKGKPHAGAHRPRTRPGFALLRRTNASIAGRMSQASCRHRFKATIGLRFRRSNPT